MRIGPLIPTTIALISGVFAWQQHQGTLALQRKVTSLSDESAKKSDAFREQGAVLDRLEEENEVYKSEFASLREKSTRPPATTAAQDRDTNASSGSSENAAAKVFSKMVKDPKLKEVTRQWQLARIKKVYGDFVRARRLNPQQTKQFFELLVKEDTRRRETGAKLLNGDEKGAGADEPGSAPQKGDLVQQLKLLLGDNAYADYEDYKKSTGDRFTLLQIQEHFARTSVPLRNDQADTLLQIMLEEHDLSLRVLDRMETILTPEQHDELQRFWEANREMQRVRIDAAREMVERTKKNDTPVAAPLP